MIGFAIGLPTPEVAFSLHRAGARVVCFSRNGQSGWFARQKFVEYVPITPPEADLDAAVADVAAVIERLRPDALVPCDDAALLLLSKMPGCERQLIVPGGSAAEFALDKWLQIETARACGMAVMPTALVGGPEDAEAFPHRPAILKPRMALDRRGAGVEKGKSFLIGPGRLSDDAQRTLRSRPYLIQEYQHGIGEGFFGIAKEGKLHAVFGHRRLRMMNPAGSGASACVSRRPDAAETAAAEALVQRVGWHGPFMIEMLRDKAGVSWFMEFNGRFWGSVALARRCGLDMPRLAVELAAGAAPGIPAPKDGGFARHLGRDLVYLLFALRGPAPGPKPHGWPGRLAALRQIACPNRLASFYNYNSSQPFFFVADAAFTVANAIGRRRG